MKSGLSLVELATKIERQQATKKDLVASTKDMTVKCDDHGALKIAVGEDEFDINPVGHAQIAGHAAVPKLYYDKMLAEAPDLLATNVNRWFEKYPQPRLLRTTEGTARALLSNRYRPLENVDLAETVFPVLADLNVEVMSCQITDTRLYIKVVDKSVVEQLPAGSFFGDGKHTIIKTRELSPAITISNSEVGMGALNIQGGLYDGFCTNLATFGERSVRKYHVGAKHEIGGEELYALLSDKTRQVTDEALWRQVRDVVKAAFDRAKFDALVNKVKGATQDTIESDDVVKVVSFAGKKFGFNEGEQKSILKHLAAGGELTRFGLYNAVTRTAEDLLDYDRASEFERAGGKIIELPKNEWKTIALAA